MRCPDLIAETRAEAGETLLRGTEWHHASDRRGPKNASFLAVESQVDTPFRIQAHLRALITAGIGYYEPLSRDLPGRGGAPLLREYGSNSARERATQKSGDRCCNGEYPVSSCHLRWHLLPTRNAAKGRGLSGKVRVSGLGLLWRRTLSMTAP